MPEANACRIKLRKGGEGLQDAGGSDLFRHGGRVRIPADICKKTDMTAAMVKETAFSLSPSSAAMV
jgi:hypothetical protein